MKLGVKLLIGVILCAVASACMSKFDKGGSAYVVRPYIKDGSYTDGTLYFEIDKTEESSIEDLLSDIILFEQFLSLSTLGVVYNSKITLYDNKFYEQLFCHTIYKPI